MDNIIKELEYVKQLVMEITYPLSMKNKKLAGQIINDRIKQLIMENTEEQKEQPIKEEFLNTCPVTGGTCLNPACLFGCIED